MSRQIQVYFSTDDIRVFEEALEAEATVLIAAFSQKDKAERIDSTITVGEKGTRSHGYLVRWQDIRGVLLSHVAARNCWYVDVLRSPVIEFDGGFEGDGFIRRGRLYFVKGFYGMDGQWVDKSGEFVDWAEHVIAMAKKLSRRDSELQAYVGKRATERKESGWRLVAP